MILLCDCYGAVSDVLRRDFAAEFFCWDCYSDSPLCGESVETQKAMYLGKTACSATNKCFVRMDNGGKVAVVVTTMRMVMC